MSDKHNYLMALLSRAAKSTEEIEQSNLGRAKGKSEDHKDMGRKY